MIKAILFDLDGVWVDADQLHWEAFNKALEIHDQGTITWQEHLAIYKGIPTKKKLELLTERRVPNGPPKKLYKEIEQTKQSLTLRLIQNTVFLDREKIDMLSLLSRQYQIYVCSNAVRASVQAMLSYSGLDVFVKASYSSEDIYAPKPDPEIYIHAIDKAMLWPEECIIVEDSDVGYKAAVASGANVCKVDGPHQVNYYRIQKAIHDAERINVVIPAAGQGKRFAEAGYEYPKPLIPINGLPMLTWVLSNFEGLDRSNIVLMLQQHIDRYCARDILEIYDHTVDLVPVQELTQGAACTVLLAKDKINTNNELLIANSDQYLNSLATISEFLEEMRTLKADGGMLTFKSSDPKWSYAKCEHGTLVKEVAEKNLISDNATVGIYYYRHGRDFVKYAEQMIAKNIRTNNEFYVCPVFNEFIQDGKRIYIHEIPKDIMYGLGTPEDFQIFLKWEAHEDILPTE